MKRQLRMRVDLDDEPLPDFVVQRDVVVPRCCRCHRDMPSASSVWTLCEECIRHDLAISVTPVTRHPPGPQAMIAALARDMARSLAKREHKPDRIPAAVQWHMARLHARGVDTRSARRLAESLATDPAHRAGCEHCRADQPAIERQLVATQREVERFAQDGTGRLRKRSAGTSTRGGRVA